MKSLLLLVFAVLSFSLKAAPATFTLSYATTGNISCAVGDTLKFYGNANDHYIVNVNATTIIPSAAVPTAPYYIGKHVVTSADTSYSIGRMSQGMKSGRITVATGTGISENPAAFMLTAYPNPATDLLTVSALDDQDAEIWSVEGKQVMIVAVKKGKNTIDLGNLRQGVYFIRLDRKVGKVIKE